jgi:hypothetical protein
VPPEAIVGQIVRKLENDEITPANFARNSVFVEFMHATIQKIGSTNDELRSRAKQLGNGDFPLIDLRSKGGTPRSEDIIGKFKVENGVIIGYERNREHRILSDHGFFRLPEWIEKKLINDLTAKAKGGK